MSTSDSIEKADEKSPPELDEEDGPWLDKEDGVSLFISGFLILILVSLTFTSYLGNVLSLGILLSLTLSDNVLSLGKLLLISSPPIA